MRFLEWLPGLYESVRGPYSWSSSISSSLSQPASGERVVAAANLDGEDAGGGLRTGVVVPTRGLTSSSSTRETAPAVGVDFANDGDDDDDDDDDDCECRARIVHTTGVLDLRFQRA